MSFGQNLTRISFVALLIASLCQQGIAAETLPAAAENISPLKAGDAAPSFTVRTVDNEPYEFDPNNLERPTVIITFRGGWCPFCNAQLSDLRHVTPELKADGFDVLFLSNDRPELLYESLKKETRENIDGLDYLILSDADLNAARAFGTAFTVSDSLIQRRNEKGDDIAGSSIDRFKALAVPAVVLVDLSGKIRYFYANPDYRVRLSADELKKEAEKLLTE